MLLCHALLKSGDDLKTDLCLVAEEHDPYSQVFPVRLLKPAEDAVFRIGPKEAVTVISGEEPYSIVIAPVPPAIIYLTPECPTQPGMKVVKIKVISTPEGFKTYYVAKGTIGDIWKEWLANKEKI